ncbi:putative WEB family protein At1g65010, chloroplastic [Chenopodium quinoa]|uniref:putative WEB family protein At1g65010, chloroplastic n=1 Tax=Chenopodium quinoa TaxID=63459 RepID=UPI000B773C0F|nr:putative WEB family protein At1g65010, chloroplastic [Chenopodium quinoa]
MQEQMISYDDIQEELNEVKARSRITERERDHAFNEMREIKMQMENADINNLKEALREANRDLQIKDKTIKSLRSEVDKLKQLEFKLIETEASLQTVKEETISFKSSLAQAEASLSDSRKKVDELVVEVGRRKDSEEKLSESVAAQTSQIEQSNVLLEESKLQVTSLLEKIQELEEERQRKDKEAGKEIERLKNEVSVHKENAFRGYGRYETASVETKTLLDEIDILKNELKLAVEAEDNSKKAMDDLAVALKEVAIESNQAKEKLTSTEQQLEAMNEEAANLKKMVKSTEEAYEALLKASKKENDMLKNTVDRLRLEAEESLLAWNDREIQFVNCIKTTDDEKNTAQEECNKLAKLLREAEGMNEKSKEENKNLRDILKQALSEANVAKEASSLARAENSYLKDALVEKDKALITLAQETERLRINEAESNDTIKELKRVIISGSKKEIAKLEKENKEQKKEKENKDQKKEKENKEQRKVAKKETAAENTEKDAKEGRRLSSTFSFDLNQFWPSIPGIACKSSKDIDEDTDEDDALGGSIFDLVGSPVKDYHRQTTSSGSSEENLVFDNFDEDAQFDDMEMDRASQGKRKALLRRFGDLLRRKNSHPPKDLPHPAKDVPPSPKEIAA